MNITKERRAEKNRADILFLLQFKPEVTVESSLAISDVFPDTIISTWCRTHGLSWRTEKVDQGWGSKQAFIFSENDEL